MTDKTARSLLALAALTLAEGAKPAAAEPGAQKKLAPTVRFADVGHGPLVPALPVPGAGAPVMRARTIRGELVGVNDHIWVKRNDAWAKLPAPVRLWDLVEAFGALWAVDNDGRLWRAPALTGPWALAAALAEPTHSARWRGTERVSPPARRASALVFTGEALLAVALDGTTWQSTDGEAWAVHAQELNLPWAYPFQHASGTYLDGNVLHYWTGARWAAVGHRANDSYAMDDERVYVVSTSSEGLSDKSLVRQAFRGPSRLLFTTDHQELPDPASLLVSGRKVGPWFPQSDGSALALRGDDASMATEAQWLHITPTGEISVLLEHGRPQEDIYTWPLHASAAGVIVAGTEDGTLVWDRHRDAPPTRFNLEGTAAIAVDGGAYLQVDDQVHWLDLATGTSASVHKIAGADLKLEAAAQGHLWLLDWDKNVLYHVDLREKKEREVASGVRGLSLWRGATQLSWTYTDRANPTAKPSMWSAPLTGGAPTEISATRALVEHGGQTLRLTSTDTSWRWALRTDDAIIGYVYGQLRGSRYLIVGDRLVQTEGESLARPIEWGEATHPWP